MAGTKVDFKRELRELYSAKRHATFVEVPELQFAMVDGHGDPNDAPEYVEAVQALFSVAYTARFALKRAPRRPGLRRDAARRAVVGAGHAVPSPPATSPAGTGR